LKIHHALKETSYLTDGFNIADSAGMATIIGNYLFQPAFCLFPRHGVNWPEMDSDFSNFVSEVWRYKPLVIILFAAGLIIFTLLVIDTYRHRKKQKRRHLKKH